MKRIKNYSLMFLMGLMWIVISKGLLFAHQEDKYDPNRPERLITMAAEYSGIEIPPDEDVSIELIFHNKGKSDEDVNVWIAEKPADWKARLKTYRFTVTGLHVPSGDDKNLTFAAEPPKGVLPGKYDFKIEAKTTDGKFNLAQTISITIKEKEEKSKEAKGVKLTTSYPVLRGPSDAKFEFSLEVESKLDQDAIFDLFAQGPEGWDINFKPAYESKYISSVRLKGNQSTTVAVEVKPAATSKEGEFPVHIRVSSGDARAEADLTVILTGTYDLEVGTPTGLLSLDAKHGKPSNMSFYVKNTGSATHNEIKFLSFKPENWKVEFKPEKIESLEPGGLKQVEIIITPHEDALVGDYSINVRVEGEKVQKTIEFRVTVKASSTWAFIGFGIIILVVLGLTVLFNKLGRR